MRLKYFLLCMVLVTLPCNPISQVKEVCPFPAIIRQVLINEGGYVDHPKDDGGPTKYGISKKFYPSLPIPSLTLKQAIDIYKNFYWKPFKYERIASSKVAYHIFDMGILVGPVRVNRIVQETLQGMGERIEANGCLDWPTVQSLNRQNEDVFISKFQKRMAFYFKSLSERKPNKKVYLKGWINRLNRIVCV